MPASRYAGIRRTGPDFAVVRGLPRTYRHSHPTPADIDLFVEIADSSLDTDREDKGALYAADSIPFYWIINLIDSMIEVYTDPDATAEPTSPMPLKSPLAWY